MSNAIPFPLNPLFFSLPAQNNYEFCIVHYELICIFAATDWPFAGWWVMNLLDYEAEARAAPGQVKGRYYPQQHLHMKQRRIIYTIACIAIMPLMLSAQIKHRDMLIYFKNNIENLKPIEGAYTVKITGGIHTLSNPIKLTQTHYIIYDKQTDEYHIMHNDYGLAYDSGRFLVKHNANQYDFGGLIDDDEIYTVTISNHFMLRYSDSQEEWTKTYPTDEMYAEAAKNKPKTQPQTSQQRSWTGTGFALKNGYVVTNYHVVSEAQSIAVVGVNGNTSTEYNAKVVATDRNNDLALLRISDSRFSGFTNIPYAVTNRMCEVGEDVFVLGYPLTNAMGTEVKLTNGIISSRSGYQGDVSTYQVSAPVQPGNSGGPLFDKKGNIVGIINAGIPDAENVGYAIKTSYLFNLVASSVSSSIIPNVNQVGGATLQDKVRSVKNCVLYIKCK